jgi:hypothetical protein
MRAPERTLSKLTAACLQVMAAAMLLSCGDDDGGPGPDEGDVDEYVEAVSSEDGSVAASKRSGEPPDEGDGPEAVAQTSSALILGGSARILLTSTASSPE